MQTSKTNPLIRLFPSLTDAAFVMPLVFLFVRMNGAKTMLGDGDTGWHIRTGEWILDNGRVPDKDIFSFTKAGEPWFAWEWLWDLLFGWMHRHWGMEAVVLGSTVVICLTFVLLFRLTRRKCGNDLIAIGMTLLAAAGSAIHWLARPHLFTLLFVVVFYSLLERVRDGNRKLLLWLPPLMVLWTNLHGGFLAGLILIGAYAAGEIAAWLVEPQAEARRAALVQAGRYAIAGATCLLVTLVNPYGYRLHVHIYRYLTDPFQYQHINEFFSFNFHHPSAVLVESLLVLGAVAAFRCLRQKRFVYVLLYLGWGHLALFSARNIPLFTVVVAPFAAVALRELLEEIRTGHVAGWIRRAVTGLEDINAEFCAIDRIPRVHAVSLAAVALLAAIFYAPAPPSKFRAEYDPKRYPAAALKMLAGPEFARGVFTDDEWGDYLIYKRYPSGKVFVDGRSDFYGAKFDEKFLDVLAVKHDWEEILRGYTIDTILLPVNAPLAGALKESARWRVAYDDGTAIVFRAALLGPSGGNETISIAQISGTGRDRALTTPAISKCTQYKSE